MASYPEFDKETTSEQVADVFAPQIRGKACKLLARTLVDVCPATDMYSTHHWYQSEWSGEALAHAIASRDHHC